LHGMLSRQTMPSWKYSISGIAPDKTALASGRDLRVSPKAAREICAYIRGRRLLEGQQMLQNVVSKSQPVPYKRHNKEVSHVTGLDGYHAGRYPVKAAREILKLLNQVQANAEFKGLLVDRLRIAHMAAQRARVIRKYIPRAFGRSSPYFDRLTHIEIAVAEE